MILNEGDKIHIIMRRRFESEARRHFIGEVCGASETIVKACGFIYVLDTAKNEYVKKPDLRTKVVSLTDAINVVNVLPDDAKIDKAVYTMSEQNNLIVTDHETFSLDINEFGAKR